MKVKSWLLSSRVNFILKYLDVKDISVCFLISCLSQILTWSSVYIFKSHQAWNWTPCGSDWIVSIEISRNNYESTLCFELSFAFSWSLFASLSIWITASKLTRCTPKHFVIFFVTVDCFCVCSQHNTISLTATHCTVDNSVFIVILLGLTWEINRYKHWHIFFFNVLFLFSDTFKYTKDAELNKHIPALSFPQLSRHCGVSVISSVLLSLHHSDCRAYWLNPQHSEG